ncbi:MAG TPA: PBP1A family penicillin-binding protein [Thermoanaerobaculia bacterium]|nr:PBP1A family penicillin-binding protein [Thermoanaerobaculia bacterium]
MQYDPLPARASGPPLSPPRSPWTRRRVLAWLGPLVVACLLGIAGGVGVAAVIRRPQVEEVSSYTPRLVTQLFDRNGTPFATFARERRLMLSQVQMPVVLRQAVIASEDRNFFRHGGIDLEGILRAEVKNIRSGRIVEGASTITMQLARTLFLSREKTWRRKVEEALIAVELEKKYSKQQLLTLYLNLVNLGHGNYGVEAASRYYFGKPAKALTLAETATLIGIIPAPSRYSPYRTPDKVLSQRNRVLRRMLEEGFITQSDADRAAAEPLLTATRRTEEQSAPYFTEEVRKYLESKYGATALYEQGLEVATTLDPQIQAAADKAVQEGLRRLDHRRGWRGPVTKLTAANLEEQVLPTWGQGEPALGRWVEGIVLASDAKEARVKIGDKTYTLDRSGIEWTGKSSPASILPRGSVAWFRLVAPAEKDRKDKKDAKEDDEAKAKVEPKLMLDQEPRMEAAAVVLESRTGAIRALVGGWDFERNKFNRITQAKRQVGSAFKPFVYGSALESGWTAADTLLDAPTSFKGADGRLSYSPQNYYRKYYGIVTLRRALELSINVATVKLMDLVGVQRTMDFARRAGIESPLPPYPSLALGTADITPIELATAYATFANQGTRVEPYLIEKVTSRERQTLEHHVPNAQSAMDPAVAFVLGHMLEGVIDHGTAYEAHDLPLDLAGKTGTTDDYSDAWFVGFTPTYTILVWTGYDQKRSLGSGMSGAVAALPMWISVVKSGLADGWLHKDEKFPVPAGIAERPIEYYTGLRPGPGSARTVDEAFVTGTEPFKDYDPKWSTVMTLPWFQQKSFYVPKEGEEMTQRPDEPGEAPPPAPAGDEPPPDAPAAAPPPPGP